jgi:predicted aconitase with swiveling domain
MEVLIKNLLVCPICRENQIKSILGEVDKRGNVIVERHHLSTTVISGKQFSLNCGKCGNKIMIRLEPV